MNTSAKAGVLIMLAGSFWVWSQPTPSSYAQPSVSEIASHFTNYQQVTKSVVLVNPELAALCRGVTKEDIEAAKIRSGPHANTGILIFMNKPAADAFGTNAVAFPVGAVIVKQKTVGFFTAKPGVGGMVKRPGGYDSDHGDWEYFYFEDSAKIESGRISACVQCHSSAKDKDYVFGTWRKSGD